VGSISGSWIAAERKQDILTAVGSAQAQGVSVTRSCVILMINRRRVVRWQEKLRQGVGLADRKPGPNRPLHALLPEERQKILAMARHEDFTDMSHRILTVTAWDNQMFFVSFTTVYRVLKAADMMTSRGCQRAHNGESLPPFRRELTGPNQRWCWDISYLPTFEKGLFLYLYLLLDEYSRKAISWLVSWRQDSATGRRLLDDGLVAENILDLAEEDRPELVNDRGRQMKAKPVRRLLEDHGMPQLFARPRTPNDNPFVESAFGTMKRFHSYPGQFLDEVQAREYFAEYFHWYNNEHYHSGIDYVTPQQAHCGMREAIVAERREKLQQQRSYRRQMNGMASEKPPDLLGIAASTNNLQGFCSVIDS
jgi:transposase InsO family protein